MRNIVLILISVACICLLQIACTKEDNNTVKTSDIGEYLLNSSLKHSFKVDSTIFDKSSSQPVRTSTHTWNLTQQGNNLNRFKVEIKNDVSGVVGGMIFTSENIENKLINNFNGLNYINLVWPRQSNTTWNPVFFDNKDRIIYISGEPIKIHLEWNAQVAGDKTSYTFNNGETVDAVHVVLADYEDKLKVRQVTEVYAKGYGLVERKMLIANTQDITSDKPWAEKAESGFQVTIKSAR